MLTTAKTLVALVAAAHVGFMIFEMFFWTSAAAMRAFSMTPDFAAATAKFAKNQGLYNGFLAAGLIWALLSRRNTFALSVFFLSCVVIAGVYGAATLPKIELVYFQALPAALALLAVFAAARGYELK